MHILYLHQYFSTREGSAGSRSYEMARYFVEQGHKVTVVFGRSSRSVSPIENATYEGKGVRRGEYEGIQLVEYDLVYSSKQSQFKRFGVMISFALKATKQVFREDYDVLFATSTPLTIVIPGILHRFFAFRKKRFVYESRDNWPEGLAAIGVTNRPLLLFFEMLARLAANTADACIALSPGIEQGIKKRLKKPTSITLVPNGCDTDLFVPDKASKAELLGVKEADLVGIFTGAHGFANGLHSVLDAASALKYRGIEDIKLVMVGDGAQKQELIERTREDGTEHICLFIDSVPKNELVKLMQAADIGLMILKNLPEYYYGTSPNKFFDYISTGLPVLNNYPGWLAEIIGEHHIGIAVAPDDPELFANALVQFRDDVEGRQKMSENARNLAHSQFSRDALAGTLLSVIAGDQMKSNA